MMIELISYKELDAMMEHLLPSNWVVSISYRQMFAMAAEICEYRRQFGALSDTDFIDVPDPSRA